MEVAMDIKKDKSMTLGIIQAIDKSLMEQSDNTTILTEEDKTKLKAKGFKIEDYTEDNLIGYKITKKTNNIDEISTTEEITANLGTEELSKDEYIFTVKKGIFKNTYKATLKNSDTDKINNGLNSDLQGNDETNTEEDILESENNELEDNIIIEENKELEDNIIIEEDTLNGENVIDEIVVDDKTEETTDFDYSTFLSSMELTMRVNLPYKALRNNATEVENEGKTLTWDFMKFKEETIEFEFVIYNIPNIIITVVGVILIIVLIIVILIKSKKKKRTNNNVVKKTNSESQYSTITDNNQVQTNPTNIIEQSSENTSNFISNQQLTLSTESINQTIQSQSIENKETQPNTITPPLEPMPEPIKLDAVSNIQNIPEQIQPITNTQNNQTSQYDSILQENTDK